MAEPDEKEPVDNTYIGICLRLFALSVLGYDMLDATATRPREYSGMGRETNASRAGGAEMAGRDNSRTFRHDRGFVWSFVVGIARAIYKKFDSALICICASWRPPYLGIIALIVGATIGMVFGSYLLGSIAYSRVASQIVKIDVIRHAPPFEWEFRIRIAVSKIRGCLRSSVLLMYSDSPDEERTYYLLGNSLNGMDFPGEAEDFVLSTRLPSYIAPGPYEIAFRSLVTCEGILGILQHTDIVDTPLYHVDIRAP